VQIAHVVLQGFGQSAGNSLLLSGYVAHADPTLSVWSRSGFSNVSEHAGVDIDPAYITEDGSNWSNSVSGDTQVFRADGVGGVYPSPGHSVTTTPLVVVSNRSAAKANQVHRFQFTTTATPRLTSPARVIGYCANVLSQDMVQCVQVLLTITEGVGASLSLVERNAASSVNPVVTSTSSATITSLTTPIDCTLTLNCGVATLVATWNGTETFTTSINLVWCAGGAGTIGLTSTGVSGGDDATGGMRIANVVAGDSISGAATTYAVPTPRDIRRDQTSLVWASKFPNTFNATDRNLGHQRDGYANNRCFQFVLDAPAPVGGVTITPSSGSFTEYDGTAAASLTIPYGSDFVVGGYVPAAGAVADVTLTFTNDAGLTDPASKTIVTAPKLCLIAGDDYADYANSNGYAPFVPALRTSLGSSWAVPAVGLAGASISTVTSYTATSVSPFYDGTRTRTAVIYLFGAVDLYNAALTPAQLVTAIQAIVTRDKLAGFTHIGLCEALSREASAYSDGTYGSGQVAFEAKRVAFNSALHTALDIDTAVHIFPIGTSGGMSGDSFYSNSTYTSDGIHPDTVTAGTYLAGLFDTWLNSLGVLTGGTSTNISIAGAGFQMFSTIF